MFEADTKPRSPNFWKIILVSVVLFVSLIGFLLFLLQQGTQEAAPLSGIFHGGDPYFEWYDKYIELTNPQVKMSSSFSGNRLVLISGVIENNGENTLDVVEVELTLYNYIEPIAKITRTPIRPGPGSRTPPLRTFEKRGFTLFVEEIPEGWLAQHAEIAIHGFRFLEDTNQTRE